MQKSSIWTNSWAVLKKELLVEGRTKTGVMSFFFFAFIALCCVSMSISSVQVEVPSSIKIALFWIIIFFATLTTLDKVFMQEKERGTFLALRLYVPAQAVFIGKFFYNFILLFSMSLFLIIGFSIKWTPLSRPFFANI